jgi:hypothetical protein
MNPLSKIGVTSLALVMVLAVMPPPATAEIHIFSTGQYGTPETISLAPSGFGAFGGGYYFIPDARLGQIWVVPITGGPPTPFFATPLGLNRLIGGLFLPSGWGDNSGQFLTAGIDNGMLVVDSSGNVTSFDPLPGWFKTPVIAPAAFVPYGGNLFVSDQNGFIWRVDPAGGGLTLFKNIHPDPFLLDPFGLEFTPAGFGSFGNRLLVSDAANGSIVAFAADGTESLFATVPFAAGQFSLRQMLLAPDDYFFSSLGIHGQLLLVSISGSVTGGGTLGALVALDSTGAVVAHLREGGILTKFDPRGMVFTADGHLLISDTSDPIYIASASDFIAGPAAGVLTALSPAHLWIGLKNSDDQGTQFDLKTELLRNGTPVASALKRCITAVTRNPDLAKETVASFDPFVPVVVTAGDVLALRVSTRIGTNPDDTKCAGPGGSHNSAVGLRLYYDSASRASRFDATIAPNPSEDLYLHSNGSPCPNGDGQSPGVTARSLDTTAPAAAKAKCNDSGFVNFAGGNPFSTIGTWSLAPLP